MHVQVGHLSQVSTFDLFECLSKFFFPKSKFPNSGCGLSASAAYTPVFTVIILWFILTVQAVQSLPAHITVEGLPKAVTSTFLKTTPGTLKEMSTSEINLNSVDHKLVRALMPFQQEGVRSVLLKI